MTTHTIDSVKAILNTVQETMDAIGDGHTKESDKGQVGSAYIFAFFGRNRKLLNIFKKLDLVEKRHGQRGWIINLPISPKYNHMQRREVRENMLCEACKIMQAELQLTEMFVISWAD